MAGRSWDPTGILLGSYWDLIGNLLGRRRRVAGRSWDPIGILLGSYWDLIGILLGSYWDDGAEWQRVAFCRVPAAQLAAERGAFAPRWRQWTLLRRSEAPALNRDLNRDPIGIL